MPDAAVIPIRRPSVHEEVAERLRQMIFERALAPGAWIDEVALSQAMSVSRTPMREALKVLAQEGLVRAVPRRGSYVTDLSEDDAEDLFPVMALLEGRCAYEAVKRATPADLRELRKLHQVLERTAAAGDLAGYFAANHVFHTRVQQLAGNPWLQRVTDDLRKFLRLLRGRQLHQPGRLDASINEHRVLLDAIENGDAARAERVMRDHLLAQLGALRALRAAERADATPKVRAAREAQVAPAARGPRGKGR